VFFIKFNGDKHTSLVNWNSLDWYQRELLKIWTSINMGKTLKNLNQSYPNRSKDGISFAIVRSNKKIFY